MTRKALARTLASLIGAAVEGVVREVIVCDRGSTDQTHHVAEHAGCHFLAEGGIAAGIARAKGEWLLILEPGARLVEGWIEAVVCTWAGRPCRRAFRGAARQAAVPGASFLGRRALAEGLVITKRQATALSRIGANAEAMARGLATRKLRPRSRRRPRNRGRPQAVLPPARFRCSSSRGMISTKLQGMWR